MYSSNMVLMCHCFSLFQHQGITSLDYNNTDKWTSALRKQSKSAYAVVLRTGTVGYNQHFSHCAWMQDMVSKGFRVLQNLCHTLTFTLHGLDPRFSGSQWHTVSLLLDSFGLSWVSTPFQRGPSFTMSKHKHLQYQSTVYMVTHIIVTTIWLWLKH